VHTNAVDRRTTRRPQPVAERAARCALPSVIGDGHPPSCGRRRRCLFLQLPHDSSSCSTPPTNPTRAEARGQRPPPPDARLSPTPLPSRARQGLDFAIPPCCSVLRPALPLAHETVLHWPRRNRAGHQINWRLKKHSTPEVGEETS
jgi:hypothetical protein